MKNNVIVLLINLSTALLLGCIIEGLFGYWLNQPDNIPSFLIEPFKNYYLYNDRNIIQVMHDCAKYDKELFYTLTPGQCEFSNREFSVTNSINSLGVRDDELSLNYPKIICIGDSFTMGWGVEQNESFPQLLEKSLGMFVLNAGISSYGTAREFNLLKRIKTDSLKYLIIQYHTNDYEENLEYINHNYTLEISSEEKYNDLQEYINRRIKYFPGKYIAYISKYLIQEISSKGNEDKDAAKKVEDFLCCMDNSKVDLDEIQIIVLNTENYRTLNSDFITTLKNNTKENHNIKVIDLSDVLKTDDYFTLDNHLNSQGHQKVAKAIFDSQFINNL